MLYITGSLLQKKNQERVLKYELHTSSSSFNMTQAKRRKDIDPD